jgi:hypothetical protein
MMRGVSLSRRRRVGIYALLVGGFLAAILTIFAVWARRQLLDEREWANTSQALIADPAINTAVAAYLTDQLYQAVDVKAELETILPPRLDPLAGSVAGAIQQPTEKLILGLLQRPRVQKLWQTAVSATHDQFINLVEDKGTAIRLPGGGAVVLDLRPILSEAGNKLGLTLTGERLPNAGRIIIMKANQLDSLQKAVKLLKTVSWFLLGISIVLLIAAVWLAHGRRREFTAAAALSLVAAAVIVLLARRLIADGVVDGLASTATGQEAANSVYAIATSLLAKIARTVLLLGIILLLGTWLAGPGSLGSRVRGWVRPALLGAPAIVHGAAVTIMLALLALNIVPGVRTWTGAILVIAVTLISVELVRRAAVADAAPPAPVVVPAA